MLLAPPPTEMIARRVRFGGVQEILISKSELLSPVMAALYSGDDRKFEWIVLLHQEDG
jgi:hypothetical protein